MNNDTTHRAHTIQTWVERSEARGIHPNADEVAARIRKTWPTLSDEDQEAIFQHQGVLASRRRFKRKLL